MPGRSFLPRVLEFANLIVVRTVSKIGLAGVRLGYAVAHPAWIAEIEKIRPPYNVNVLTQAVVPVLLEHGELLAEQAATTRHERERVAVALAALRRVNVFPDAGQFRPDPGAGRAALVCDFARCGHTGEECVGHASAAGQLPAHHDRHARPKTTRSSPRCHATNELIANSANSVATCRQAANRTASLERNTNETQIAVDLNLDGTGRAELATGVPFLDHMLDQVARHGMLDLKVRAKGDLHIDGHHTVEDIGITFGQAFKAAVGDKKGIVRYGYAYVPLDEALSRVVIDLSGRPGLEFHVPFTRAMIGTFDVDLAHEFFQGFTNHAQVTLHVDNLRGDNAHHQAETVFKAFARALRMACTRDPRATGVLPSTKGAL